MRRCFSRTRLPPETSGMLQGFTSTSMPRGSSGWKRRSESSGPKPPSPVSKGKTGQPKRSVSGLESVLGPRTARTAARCAAPSHIGSLSIPFSRKIPWPSTSSSLRTTSILIWWQVINLAPTNWRNVSQWLQRDHLVAYDFARGVQRLIGAVMYAVRRCDEVEQVAAAVVECTLLEPLSRGTGCHTRMNQHADVAVFASVSHALASALPLVRIDSDPSVRAGGFVNPQHMSSAREHLEAWDYVAFLHQPELISGKG
mmetsp:Transcript_11282/g.26515  ORF Transcript_11282/g.26515 Transcript_11282/m.26515 type:complete len:256 (-) Transcript_11282:66-833(-)